MAKRKKRNAITLVSLLLALALLIGFYVWYSNKKSTEGSTEDTAQKINVATLDTTKVTSLHYTAKDIDINLALEDGVWKSKEEPDRPINQDNVKGMLSTIASIDATQEVVDKPDDLSEYGLDKPQTYIQSTLKDGSKVTLQLGSKSITGDGYYALVNDDTKVYLVGISYGSGLSYSDLDMTAMAKAPEITAENITYINVDSRDGEDVELKLSDTNGLDNSGTGDCPWKILKPYGNGYAADTSNITSLQPNYTSFNYLDCVDYKGDDLSKYGLDNPAATVEVGYFETQATPTPTPAAGSDTSTAAASKINLEYKIYIGNKDEDGNYYVRIDGSNAVYTLEESSVDKMLKIDVFSLVNPYVAIPNIDTVDKISADMDGKAYTMEIKHSAATKDDSKDTKATYYYNKKEVKEDLFKNLYRNIISVKYDAQLKDKVDISKLKPVMTLSFHIFGDNEATVKASYLPYNDSFYIVDKGTGIYFLVDKRVVDDMANTIKTFKGNE